MARPTKPARLEIREDRYKLKDGSTRITRSYEIRDGSERIRTGIIVGSPGSTKQADEALRVYLENRHKPESASDPNITRCWEVLSLYLDHQIEKKPKLAEDTAKGREFRTQIGRLNDFFGDDVISDLNGERCRAFARQRTTASMARKELQLFRAAIGHWHTEYVLPMVPTIVLPPKGPARHRWLTRDEAAKLIWAFWRMKHPRTGVRTGAHLARFMLIAMYTGTREGAVISLQWQPNLSGGYIDLDAGVIYRARDGEEKTKKRKPPFKIPNRLLPHLRRWKRRSNLPWVVHYNGQPISRANNSAWRKGVAAAGLAGTDVMVHTLRHTCATWLMQGGRSGNPKPVYEVAGFLGMKVEMLEDVYGHHHPDYQNNVAEAF